MNYFTTTQGSIPETAQEAEAHMDQYPYVKKFGNYADARKDISQTGARNVLLAEQPDGSLKIEVALWDSM